MIIDDYYCNICNSKMTSTLRQFSHHQEIGGISLRPYGPIGMETSKMEVMDDPHYGKVHICTVCWNGLKDVAASEVRS